MRSDAPEYHEPLKIETTETPDTKTKRRRIGAHAVRRRSGLLPVTSPARGDAFPRPPVVEKNQSAKTFLASLPLGFGAYSGPFCGRFWGRLRGGARVLLNRSQNTETARGALSTVLETVPRAVACGYGTTSAAPRLGNPCPTPT